MNKKMFLLFNHQLTSEQTSDAFVSLQIDEIVELNDDLKKLWKSIPPECETDLKKYLDPIMDFFKSQHLGDIVLVSGDFGAVFYIVTELKKIGLIPMYSTTTKFDSIDKKQKDGSIITERISKHVCFRKY